MAKGLSKSSKLYIFFCNLICVQIGEACIRDHVCVCLWLCKGVPVFWRPVAGIGCPHWLLSTLDFEIMSITEPGALQFCWNGWLVSSEDLSASTLPTPYLSFLVRVLGIWVQVQSACLWQTSSSVTLQIEPSSQLLQSTLGKKQFLTETHHMHVYVCVIWYELPYLPQEGKMGMQVENWK